MTLAGGGQGLMELSWPFNSENRIRDKRGCVICSEATRGSDPFRIFSRKSGFRRH